MYVTKTGAGILLLSGALLVAAGCTRPSHRESGATAGSKSLPRIEIACKQPSIAEKGTLSLDVTVFNETDQPVTLMVCDRMSLCCIRGLHPIVELGSGEGGMGVLDFCESAEPAGREVRLAPGTRFETALDLPAKRLPPRYLQNKGNILAVYCAFETESGAVKSNVIDVTVK